MASFQLRKDHKSVKMVQTFNPYQQVIWGQNIKNLQKWLSHAIKCTRPPGHLMGTGDYAVWAMPVKAEDVPYTKDF